MCHIYTVTDLTALLRKAVEERIPYVWVRGEVSGVSRPQSGHIYFKLKDSRAQLQCAWFAGRQQKGGQKFDPLTGEVFEKPRPSAAEIVRNGIELLCAGKLDIYAPRGEYQLLVESAQPAGAGLLALEFENRKKKLAALGYFASERKRPLPEHARRVALLTSRRGAAIHDFLEISRLRGLASRIRLYPVLVQGQGAAEIMADAIRLINFQNWADVIVLIRGGGSMEDLWAFNEECLAAAIFESKIPVLAGIGHEVDFTLADMTADIRAATPTHAAQILWLPRHELWQRLDNISLALDRCFEGKLNLIEKTLDGKIGALRFFSPANKLQRSAEKFARLVKQMERAATLKVEKAESSITSQERELRRAASLRVEKAASGLELQERELERAMALNMQMRQNRFETAANAMRKSKAIAHRLANAASRLDLLASTLAASQKNIMASCGFGFNYLRSRLQALDPEAPLKRGYALLHGQHGLIRKASEAAIGDIVEAQLQDGSLVMNVKNKIVNTDKPEPEYSENDSKEPV